MKKERRLLYLLKIIILTILFYASVCFESAQRQRLYVLVVVFVLYLAVGYLRCLIKHSSILFCLSFVLDIALVYILEHNSRLLINYFFHSFYIIILLEGILSLGFRSGMAVGTAAVLVSLIKYGYLIYYRFNLSSVSQMAFFLMVNVLILVIAGFAEHNREEKDRKDILYRELLDAHRQLKQYTDEVNRLTLVEERSRIARDLHDTLGHNMTALIMQLQMAEHFLKEDSPKAEELITKAVGTAKDSLSGIREVVETLRGIDAALPPAEAIGKLIKKFSEKTGAHIELKITGDANLSGSKVNTALYHILQEAMTNAVRHGKASNIWVRLDYSMDSISFCVKDNGAGAEAVKEGYGLRGIRERVEYFGGKVEFGGYPGFSIKGILYLEGKDDKSVAG